MNPSNPNDLDKFQEWLRSVGQTDLWRWLCDAYWQGQLEGTELVRAYLLAQKGVDTRTTPQPEPEPFHDIPRLGPNEDITFGGTIIKTGIKHGPYPGIRPIK